MIGRGLSEEILQDRNLGQDWKPGERPGLLIFHHSAQQIHLALSETHFVLDLPLSDDGLRDAADIGSSVHFRDFHGDLERDIPARMYSRSHVYVHTHIQVLKLGVDKGINTHTANAGLK